MKKLREIFWRYFVEKKWGRMWGLKEPNQNDNFGVKLFGLMNFIGFLYIVIIAGVFFISFL